MGHEPRLTEHKTIGVKATCITSLLKNDIFEYSDEMHMVLGINGNVSVCDDQTAAISLGDSDFGQLVTFSEDALVTHYPNKRLVIGVEDVEVGDE